MKVDNEYHRIIVSERYYKLQEKRDAPKFREYIRELIPLTGMTREEIKEYEIEKQKEIKRNYQNKYIEKNKERLLEYQREYRKKKKNE